MCGILGEFILENRQVNAGDLHERLYELKHRGPDGIGLWISTCMRVGLGHCRLSILDKSENGSQPMICPNNRFVIIFNGEIYNYKILKHELISKGYIFKGRSDTEVLLYMYQEYGLDIFARINGIYAFAIYDALEAKLLVARDPFGNKPLYYTCNETAVKFSSSIRNLVNQCEHKPSENEDSIKDFQTFGHVLGPKTIFTGINELAPGCFFEIKDGVKLDDQVHTDTSTLFDVRTTASSKKDKIKSFEKILNETIHKHLISDVDIGVLLSAGVDSALLLACAKEISDRPIKALTIVFEGFEQTVYDERVGAALVANALGVEHHTMVVSNSEFKDDFPKIIKHMDQPTTDAVNTWFAAKFANKLGLKVVLSGLGSDEIFGGYPSYKNIPKLYNMLNLNVGSLKIQKIILLSLSFLQKVSVINNAKLSYLKNFKNNFLGIWMLYRSINPHYLTLYKNYFLKKEKILVGNKREMKNKISYLEMKYYLSCKLLRDSDWASMAHSVELRTPFVDLKFIRDLQNFGMLGEISKHDIQGILSQKLNIVLPKRAKIGFQIPYKNWLSMYKKIPSNDHPINAWASFILKEYRKSAIKQS